jgi:hypothetical protein
MATVICKNDISLKGEKKECGKFLAILPPSVITALKDNPQDKMILRCHDCPGETKWVDVYYSPGVGFVWKIHEGEITYSPEDKMQFDEVNCSKIGG